MTPDERTILLLAAEALRVATLKADKAKHLNLLADALDRIAGEERPKSINAGVRGSTPVVASAGDPTGERMAPALCRCGKEASVGKTLCWGCYYNSIGCAPLQTHPADALDRIAGAESTSGRSVSRSEALRISEETLIRAEQERVTVLEDAEGDDPRFDPEPENQFGGTTTLDPRFTPNSGKCWRCGQATLYEVLCSPCWGKAPKPSGVLVGNDEVRAWIEAEERGKP